MPQSPDNKLPENSKRNLDEKLDQAIEETFPTSDPVSVTITKGGAIDYDDNGQIASDVAPNDKAEPIMGRAKETVRSAMGSVSDVAQDAYEQGKRYMRQAGTRYPQAERYYREGSGAVRSHVRDRPFVSVLLGVGIGYALAWAIHSDWWSAFSGNGHLPSVRKRTATADGLG